MMFFLMYNSDYENGCIWWLVLKNNCFISHFEVIMKNESENLCIFVLEFFKK